MSYYTYEFRKYFFFLVEYVLKLAVLFAVVYAAVTLANQNKKVEGTMDNKGTATVFASHFDGGIQCLSYFQNSGVRVGVGIFQPGSYDVGDTANEEHIQVTSGLLVINGVSYPTGSALVVPKGTHLKFEVSVQSTYFCTYH